MASVTSTATGQSSKRVRPWDACDDVRELKALLEEKEELIEELQLQASNKRQQKKKNEGEDVPGGNGPTGGKKCAGGRRADASKLRKSIKQQILSQMVYKPSMKTGCGRATAEVPNVSEADVRAILGEGLFAKAARKGKLIEARASEDEAEALFGCFAKRLRYGAQLVLEEEDGLKFAFATETCALKVTAAYRMIK